jgi:cell division protein FtsA
LESAEKIKLFLSNPLKKPLKSIDDMDEERHEKVGDEIDLSSLALAEELKKVSRKTLIDGIIRPRLNELFTMIGIELKKSGFIGQTPSGLVITGGGARTVGVTDAAKRMLAMPVRVAIATNVKGIIDEIGEPSFSTVVGLLNYGRTIDIQSSLPFGFSIPKIGNLKFNGKLFSKFIAFAKSFLP